MLSWIRKQLQKVRCDETDIRKIELASEEALVNIIQHGYRNTSGTIQISVQSPRAGMIEITLRDQGPPFNPLGQKVQFDPSATLEDRPIGGLGILFIRQYMDDVRYRRDRNSNVLCLMKRVFTK
jgi:serine/threonine-protein kinase RsbW